MFLGCVSTTPRHTCGTLMHLENVPVAVIAASLGHAPSAFTMATYVHSQDPALAQAADLVKSRDEETHVAQRSWRMFCSRPSAGPQRSWAAKGADADRCALNPVAVTTDDAGNPATASVLRKTGHQQPAEAGALCRPIGAPEHLSTTRHSREPPSLGRCGSKQFARSSAPVVTIRDNRALRSNGRGAHK